MAGKGLEVIKKAFGNFLKFLRRYGIAFLFSLSLLFYAISFQSTKRGYSIEKDCAKLEKRICRRENIMEDYARRALAMPSGKWLDFKDFPSDMVIYKYDMDTIQSWINQFPISGDDINVISMYYRLNNLTSGNYFDTFLGYLTNKEQYVNLGSAWYLVKTYEKENVKVIAGLLVKTEYLSDNAVIKNELNPAFGLKGHFSIVPVSFDTGYVVKGKDGGVLFSVINDVDTVYYTAKPASKWISFLFAFLALLVYLLRRRTYASFLIFIFGITVLRFLCFRLGESLSFDSPLFSPNIYAFRGIFSSFGNLLLNNLYVFFAFSGVFVLRRKIWHSAKNPGGRRTLILLIMGMLPILLFLYIHFTLCSLIRNSVISLELFNLDELNIYSLYSYISYGLLFVVLLLVMQAFVSASRPFKVSTLISTKAIIVYSIFAASYMMSVIFVLGFKKECERSKVWANKLSVERDLGMEIKLRSIESAIQYDQAILSMFSYPGYGITSIQNRINEIYLQGASQKYEMQITVFKPSGGLIYSGGRMIGEDMFRSEILQYGSPLSRKEKFFFLNNYNGRVSYIGFFTYTLKDGSNIDLYVELESRKEVSGVPALLFDYKQANNLNIPGYYSYAKFINARLVLYRGQYNYSTVADTSGIRDGFSIIKRDGYVHFVNKFSDDNIIMVSRKEKSAIPYIVSISYVILFILLLFLLFFSLRRINTGFFIMRLPKNSFRRKITTLLVTSLVVSLLCMGIGCVWLSVQYYNEENRSHMEEKLLTAQSTIADYCKYADSYNSINTSGLYDAMSRLAGDIRTNINLYSPQGSLIRSTQPELFERFLLSSRMNSSAFYKIIRGRKRQLINKERISGLKYYSLYAPVFNLSGTLIAIVNIPYFSRTADLRGDISSIIAAIINFYILLLLASIFGGTMVSNSLSRPLAEISTKMRLMDISKKTEHINYKNNDELGVLVKAYNKMLDDVQAGTRAIAETERKQAWSEMARQIAHEIKNPLTPMRLSIQYLVRLKKNNVTGWQDKFEDISQSILEQIDILSETASEFSSFAKFYYEEKSVINLYDIVKEERLLFDNKADIKILFDYCSEQCPVFVRKGQIIRVVVNLLSNAVQALEPAGRGYIRISIKESGEYYVVSFEDNGPGVKEEDLDKLFKPNFTTKSSGTGLGLAISKNIIDQSGGSISYRKSQFGGADFSFRLKKYYDI